MDNELNLKQICSTFLLLSTVAVYCIPIDERDHASKLLKS